MNEVSFTVPVRLGEYFKQDIGQCFYVNNLYLLHNFKIKGLGEITSDKRFQRACVEFTICYAQTKVIHFDITFLDIKKGQIVLNVELQLHVQETAKQQQAGAKRPSSKKTKKARRAVGLVSEAEQVAAGTGAEDDASAFGCDGDVEYMYTTLPVELAKLRKPVTDYSKKEFR
jgi:hypothetical protein